MKKIDISKFASKEVEVKHVFNGEEIVLMVQPDNFTIKFVREAQNAATEEIEMLAKLFIRVVMSWNLELELSSESLESLPVILVKELTTKVATMLNASSEEAKN